MKEIIQINRKGVFSLEEAQNILPIIFRITKTCSEKVEALVERLDALSSADQFRIASLENEVNLVIQEWQTKVQKLGAQPKGLWIADFDSGDGYYCWKFPEKQIQYWHKYTDGFSKRVHVELRDRPNPLRHFEDAHGEETPACATCHSVDHGHERGPDRRHKKIYSFAPITLQPSDMMD